MAGAMLKVGDRLCMNYLTSDGFYVYGCTVEEVLKGDAVPSNERGKDGMYVALRFIETGELEPHMLLSANQKSIQQVKRSRTHGVWAFREDGAVEEHAAKQPQLQPAPETPAEVASKPRAAKAVKASANSAPGAMTPEQLRVYVDAQFAELKELVETVEARMDVWQNEHARGTELRKTIAVTTEEVRKLKHMMREQGGKVASANDGEASADAAANANAAGPSRPASKSKPQCCKCKAKDAYNAPMACLMDSLKGDHKHDMSDMFKSGRLRPDNPLKGSVECAKCIKTDLQLAVVPNSSSNGMQCDWCRCSMSAQTTGWETGWCGSRHNNCREKVIQNESDRDRNNAFMETLVRSLRPVVPFTELELVSAPAILAAQYNEADYAIVATNTDVDRRVLRRVIVIVEIDNDSHSSGGLNGQYSPKNEADKNDRHFKVAGDLGFDSAMLLRINPSASYRRIANDEDSDSEATQDDVPDMPVMHGKKARWLVARDWVVTFLRQTYGAWAWGDRVLVYLFYDENSPRIDQRPAPRPFDTVVVYQAPALPDPKPADLADWACCIDPYILIKGSVVARVALALDDRFAA